MRLFVVATPKFAAQAIRKVYDIGWKPMFFLTNVAIWISTVLEPAGVEKAVGIMSSVYVKDPADPGWDSDPDMKEWKAWMTKYMPEADPRDQNYVNSYNRAMALVQALKQAGNDLSRDNIMKQAANIKDLQLPMMLPGHQGEHQPDRLLSDRGHADDALERQAVGSLRRLAVRQLCDPAAGDGADAGAGLGEQ